MLGPSKPTRLARGSEYLRFKQTGSAHARAGSEAEQCIGMHVWRCMMRCLVGVGLSWFERRGIALSLGRFTML